MKNIIEKAIDLKQKLIDFVYDAEDEIAVALETYALEKGKKNSYGIKQQNITIDLFVTDGRINNQTPLDIFLASTEDLNTEERGIIQRWQNNFIGLFEIQVIANESYQLMNWLTAKTYKVCGHSQITAKETQRWQPGEIILAIIAPINEFEWFFFSDRIIKGRLSQPKLAVAIGEFRDSYPEFLYADAPELLEQAWSSVALYHQEFVDYFGSDSLTLPGYKLNQKIGELQQRISEQKLKDAGIDSNKSLSQMLSESNTNEADFTETASDLGVDTKAIDNIIKNQNKLSMVTPKVNLPPEIKQAENVTVFSHPQWGQIFLPNFNKFIDLLNQENILEAELDTSLKYIKKYLEQPEASYYIWQQLTQNYAHDLEVLLQKYTQKNDFHLERDLDSLLLEYNKLSKPKLPAIASVPIHLNNLFETAVAQVQKNKSKHKKQKQKKGFS
ncbi:hypothetical protein I4641_17145 [Waterburya agarophytonicola K14]|uniref:Uncharacterized protein n=1 Tax=Waterburya agarophytonicola KI4 TaxID=2874699 RepID=A0A964BS68_9CYAN|nr:hypothetical protein [Waterburya agarophytonicola]MCC0178699.1 hypothetical protein [Waterburya agarophytonicola KI4]